MSLPTLEEVEKRLKNEIVKLAEDKKLQIQKKFEKELETLKDRLKKLAEGFAEKLSV